MEDYSSGLHYDHNGLPHEEFKMAALSEFTVVEKKPVVAKVKGTVSVGDVVIGHLTDLKVEHRVKYDCEWVADPQAAHAVREYFDKCVADAISLAVDNRPVVTFTEWREQQRKSTPNYKQTLDHNNQVAYINQPEPQHVRVVLSDNLIRAGWSIAWGWNIPETKAVEVLPPWLQPHSFDVTAPTGTSRTDVACNGTSLTYADVQVSTNSVKR